MLTKSVAAGAVAGFCCLVVAGAASAAPLLEAEIFDNGTQVGSITTSATGTLQFTTADASFSSIQLSANGVPILPSPDLASQTTRVSTASGFTGTHDLKIVVTQTGLTGFTGAMNFTSSFSALFLIGSGAVSNDVLSNYYDAGNTAFATTTLLAQASCTAVAGCGVTPINTTVGSVSSAFSETEVFDATFTAGSATLQSSAQLTGSVPEPASLALLGTGLAALGLIRRRRQV